MRSPTRCRAAEPLHDVPVASPSAAGMPRRGWPPTNSRTSSASGGRRTRGRCRGRRACRWKVAVATANASWSPRNRCSGANRSRPTMTSVARSARRLLRCPRRATATKVMEVEFLDPGGRACPPMAEPRPLQGFAVGIGEHAGRPAPGRHGTRDAPPALGRAPWGRQQFAGLCRSAGHSWRPAAE